MEVRVRKFVNYLAQAKYLYCWISTDYPQDASTASKAEATSTEILEMLTKAGVLVDKKSVPNGGNTTDKVAYIRIDLDEGTVVDQKSLSVKFRYNTDCRNVFRLTDAKGELIHQTPEGKVECMIGPDFINEFHQIFSMEVSAGSIVGYNKFEMADALAAWIDNTEK